MEHEEILHRCFRCGYCKLPASFADINCPSYLAYRFETYSPGGRMWLLRALLDGKIEASPRLCEILFSCTECGNCTENCAMTDFKDRLLSVFSAGKETLLDTGRVPAPVRDYLTRVQLHGNPYGMSGGQRASWAADTGIASYAGQEYLFFADDVGSYDPRGQEIARSVARVLAAAGISFGILEAGVGTDGNDVKAVGESLLFEQLAQKNIAAFNAAGVEKVITLSPHSFNTFKKDYPALGGWFQVFHYTQVLAFKMGSLKFCKDPDPVRITFHDPCYLGRHNLDYQSPRMVLSAVPGVTLVEMERNRKNALCCGGGGGNFYTDILGGGEERAARYRVKEAYAAGVNCLSAACPQCAVMLDDAVKSEGLTDALTVKEVSEVVAERLQNA